MEKFYERRRKLLDYFLWFDTTSVKKDAVGDKVDFLNELTQLGYTTKKLPTSWWGDEIRYNLNAMGRNEVNLVRRENATRILSDMSEDEKAWLVDLPEHCEYFDSSNCEGCEGCSRLTGRLEELGLIESELEEDWDNVYKWYIRTPVGKLVYEIMKEDKNVSET